MSKGDQGESGHGWILLVVHVSLAGVIYSGREGCISTQMIGAQLR